MARTKGSMKLGQNIEPQIGAPLDARLLVKTKADLTNEKSYEYPYVGMKVMVKDELKEYILKAKDTTVAENWELYSSGGSGEIDPEILEGLATKEDLEDYATKAELDDYATKAEISDFITTNDLSTYATKSELLDYATVNSLDSYATKASLSDYQTKAESQNFVTSTDLDNYATKADLTGIDYETALINLPKINNKTLIGNLSFSDLGLSVNEDGTVDLKEVKIVSWANGTDEQIVKMVEAADNGDINLYDYWAVGDERIIHTNGIASDSDIDYQQNTGQDMCFVLLDTGDRLYDLYKDNSSTSVFYNLSSNSQQASGRINPWFIVGMKNNLMQPGRLEKNYPSSIKYYNDTKRRTWCNNTFKAALPSPLVNIFKEFRVPTLNAYNFAAINNYFALYGYYEVNPVKTSDNNTYLLKEKILKQFKYFSDNYNHRKHKNGGVDTVVTSTAWGAHDAYYSRDPYDNGSYWLVVPKEPSNASYIYKMSINESAGISVYGAI